RPSSRLPHGANRITFGWLGTSRTPGQFVLFWMVTLVIRVAGKPPTKQVTQGRMCREGPITTPEATPVATPGLSPLVSGIVVARLWAGIRKKKVWNCEGIAVGPSAMFG